MSELNQTISEATRSAALKFKDKIFLCEKNGRSISFSEFDEVVDRIASFLVNGLDSDRKVAIILALNSIDFFVVMFACIRAGFVINVIPHNSAIGEIKERVNRLNADVVISNQIRHELALDAETLTFSSLLEIGNSGMWERLDDDLDRLRFSVLFNSSGTTAIPKLIAFKSETLVTNARNFADAVGSAIEGCHLALLPAGHTSVLAHQIFPSVFSGAKVLIANGFLSIAKNWMELVAEYKISYIQVVPSIAHQMIRSVGTTNGRRLTLNETLSFVCSGSAPLYNQISEGYFATFGIPLLNLYGTSEIGPIFFPSLGYGRAGSIGRLQDRMEFKLLHQQAMDDSVVGEFLVKGPSLAEGYIDQYGNLSCFVDDEGFYHTGDILSLDPVSNEWGYKCRGDDMFNRNGVNVSANYIEDMALQSGLVTQAVALAKADQINGCEIQLFFCSDKIQNGDILKKWFIKNVGLEFLPNEYILRKSIPMTASGKPIKRLLEK